MKIDNQNILSRGRIISQRTRPQDQTGEEWLAGYCGDQGLPNSAKATPRSIAKQPHQGLVYRYQGYLTRKDARGKGRLILELRDADTGEIFQCFFNANITYQRGEHKGAYFKTGRSGRFWIFPDSKFARFWLATIGKTDKWSRIYRQLNRLKPIRFSGFIKSSANYNQIVNLKAVKKQ